VKRAFFLATALSFAAAIATAQFEGVADFKITMSAGSDKSSPGEGRIFLAPSGYRMEWAMDLSSLRKSDKDKDAGKASPAPLTMTMLVRKADPGKVYMLNDDKKTYSVIDSSKAAEEHGKTPKESFTVRKLGTATVAGHSCQNVLLTSSKGTEIEVCVAKDLAASSDWLAALNRRQPDGGSWLSALKDQGIEGFPVRWVIRKKGSTQALATMEMTRLEKKSLPASLFEIPAGYKEAEFAIRGLTPEQEKAMSAMRERMTPEQRRAYEDAMKRYGKPTPKP
jgi:hypothetical protein